MNLRFIATVPASANNANANESTDNMNFFTKMYLLANELLTTSDNYSLVVLAYWLAKKVHFLGIGTYLSISSINVLNTSRRELQGSSYRWW